jgi:hypothetical protein
MASNEITLLIIQNYLHPSMSCDILQKGLGFFGFPMNIMTYEIEQDAIDHADVISKHDRFSSFTLDNHLWELGHLNPFAFKAQIDLADGGSVEVDVVVLFSNHCFSHALEPGEVVDDAYIVLDGKNKRVLDKKRHALSRTVTQISSTFNSAIEN